MPRAKIIEAFACLVLFFAAPPLRADDKAPVAVQWYVMDYPPSYIVSGPEKGTGYQDKILDYFASKMPGFRIERHPAAIARLLSNLSNGVGVCSGSLGRTAEREKHMVFSDPILYSLPTRLVVTAAAAPKVRALLDANGKIQPEKLAKAGFVRAGVVKGRTYGPVVDAFLARHKDEVSSTGRTELVFRMLARGRVDYSFSYPDEAGYYARIHMAADDDSSFTTFPIAGLPDVMASYFACSKDAVGRKVIGAVNKVISEHRSRTVTTPWTHYYLSWIDKNARHDIELAQDHPAQR
ncbi:transporter substrate-binding domain-containing protein [Kordiimonas marina]|uniref:transporter substrate-binding domain-containing protein n=1 Tax=Kordiimonas marina TaxID=2872312 RepID=UPI001FF32C49|nr:transporter substrate-binding domain-containing protein [Kordiimonas marina]MCJ9428445.1 transporter substrate-binding domain-containing protein [Kordiimonas marina]